ncbi:MAG: CvpA family protein [Cyclobacteriaceae bacterium]|nr:CvpA family protein [Cyclobacteriaceae bacterium]MDW8330826.1 CvpA family protein [Cyclobacteriaceae bacterium]
MNFLDGVLLIFLGLGIISGYHKGFVFMVFSLAALVLGVVAGIFLTAEITSTLRPHVHVNDKWLPLLSFVLVFAVTLLIVRTAGALMSWALHKTIFGFPDKVLGALLGAVKSVFWLALLIWLVDSLKANLPWWVEESWTYRILGNALTHVLPG